MVAPGDRLHPRPSASGSGGADPRRAPGSVPTAALRAPAAWTPGPVRRASSHQAWPHAPELQLLSPVIWKEQGSGGSGNEHCRHPFAFHSQI